MLPFSLSPGSGVTTLAVDDELISQHKSLLEYLYRYVWGRCTRVYEVLCHVISCHVAVPRAAGDEHFRMTQDKTFV